RGFYDVHGDNLPHKTRVAVENNDMVRHRPSRELLGPGLVVFQGRLAQSLHEDVDTSTDMGEVILEAYRVLNAQQVVVATFFHFFGNVILVEFIPLRARAGTVFEDKAVLETSSAHQVATALEGLFRFPTKADDKVAADGHLRDDFPAPSQHVFVELDGVLPLH